MHGRIARTSGGQRFIQSDCIITSESEHPSASVSGLQSCSISRSYKNCLLNLSNVQVLSASDLCSPHPGMSACERHAGKVMWILSSYPIFSIVDNVM
jgi:hypothetical protein